MMHFAAILVQWLSGLVLVYFILLNAVYLMTSLFSFAALRKYARRMEAADVEESIAWKVALPIGLIVPAHNEESTCVESVRALLTLKYPDYEILVVNDGSVDQTLDRLKEAYHLVPRARFPTAEIKTAAVKGIFHSQIYPNLWVFDKENGGKADALNAGLKYCRAPLFCAIDADSLLEREALTRIVRPFLEDAATVAAGGIIRVFNGCRVHSGVVTDIRLPKSYVARFQVLEYLRAFLAGRMGWDALNATLVISGAFGLFRRSTVVDVGGYAVDTVGEDMELVVRLHRHCREKKIPYKVTFIPDPVAWTECPESYRILGRQRDRWQRGLMESLCRHQKMLFNARYGRIGLLVFPYFYFLEMMGPVIEFFGYIAFILALLLGAVSPIFIAAFLMVAFVLGISLSILAVGLEELSFRRYRHFVDFMQLFWIGIIENFGYRQFVNYWRIRGVFSYFRRVRGWGTMQRRGFQSRAQS